MRRGNVQHLVKQPLNEAARLVEEKQAQELLTNLKQQVFNVGAEINARNQEVRDASAALIGMETAAKLLALEIENQALREQLATTNLAKNTAKVARQVGMFAQKGTASTEEENCSSSNSATPAA